MQKLLVRVPQWLGDAVVSTVFLSRLKARRPDAKITVACMPGLAPIFETHPDVEAVIKLPYPAGNVFEAAQMIRAGSFDEAYILPRSFRSALECFLGKVPVRIGHGGDLRGLLLTKPLPYNDKLLYAHRYLSLLGDETADLSQFKPHFPASEPASPPVLKKPVLGMAPVSIAPSRTWLPERFIETANRFLEEKGGTVVLFGSPSERSKTEVIKKGIKGNVVDTVGGLGFPELGWMMKQCDTLLANDSGLMHVASAVGTPAVILFGASDPKQALPPWGKFETVRHEEIFCVPCLRNECVRFGEDKLACLKAIKTGEVMSTISKMLCVGVMLFIGACAPVGQVTVPPPTTPPTVNTPVFDRTFGEITVGSSGSLVMRYKNMTLLIDPADDVSAAALSPQVDYLFLTDGSPRRMGVQSQNLIRKNIKMIVPPETARVAQGSGFSEVKGLSEGNRVMLKKNEDFVFVSAAQSRGSGGYQASTYLLEFDNGRNILIVGETNDVDSLRELVYSLRDEGKPIYVGFFNCPSGMKVEELAKMVSLIQPQNAVLLQTNSPGAPVLNEAGIAAALKEELYEGPVLVLKGNTQIPF